MVFVRLLIISVILKSVRKCVDYYLDYAENSNDQKAYYYALKNMKHITHAQFDYTPAYEPDNKVDTEKMWQEIKTLFNKTLSL